MRRGQRFLASKSRAEFLSNPIKGERQALASILYETQVSVEPVQEIKAKPKPKKKTITEVSKKKKRTRKKKDK